MFDLFKSLLKAEGYSLTAARKAVFAALQHREPQTMHNIVAACRGQADRASVYRTIQLFESLGVVQRLQIGWKYKLELSDKFSSHHHHLSCTKCGRTIAIDEDPALEKRMRLLAKTNGFLPQDHQLEIRGLCSLCKAGKS
ncbi:MAG TPA: Fur family transcriptional regulator [Candidatus Saccharimonadales bacterium]|jgi:Fur family ferric uptake transcriptional regulator